jgi:hypothetical protein
VTQNQRQYAHEAQLLLANITTEALAEASVQIETVEHDEFTSFVKSKARVDEDGRLVTIHQFVTERDATSGRPTQVRLKVKSGESLNRHFPAADGPALADDRNITGADLIATWVQEAVAASDRTDAAEVAAAFVIDGDSMAAAGQDWVPAFATARVEDGVVHLQSRSMFIAQMHPLPAGFTPPPGVLGVHYIAAPAPELIADLVDGVTSL